MIESGGRVRVEDHLVAVPVTLRDVRKVQNAQCVTTALDLEDDQFAHCSEYLT